MKKSGMSRKLANLMKKHGRPTEEINFERKNLSAWWDRCSEASPDELKAFRDGVVCRVDAAIKEGDKSGYTECRSLFIAIAEHFMTDCSELNSQTLKALKLAYRKHHLNDDRIGWDELSGVMRDALCEAMGDGDFCQWLEAIEAEGEAR